MSSINGQKQGKGLSKRRFARILLATALILLIPFAAMLVSDDVRWSLADFAVMGFLLVGAGLTYELIVAGVGSGHRVVVGVVVLAVLALLWVELAVGLFGSPFAGS